MTINREIFEVKKWLSVSIITGLGGWMELKDSPVMSLLEPDRWASESPIKLIPINIRVIMGTIQMLVQIRDNSTPFSWRIIKEILYDMAIIAQNYLWFDDNVIDGILHNGIPWEKG